MTVQKNNYDDYSTDLQQCNKDTQYKNKCEYSIAIYIFDLENNYNNIPCSIEDIYKLMQRNK